MKIEKMKTSPRPVIQAISAFGVGEAFYVANDASSGLDAAMVCIRTDHVCEEGYVSCVNILEGESFTLREGAKCIPINCKITAEVITEK